MDELTAREQKKPAHMAIVGAGGIATLGLALFMAANPNFTSFTSAHAAFRMLTLRSSDTGVVLCEGQLETTPVHSGNFDQLRLVCKSKGGTPTPTPTIMHTIPTNTPQTHPTPGPTTQPTAQPTQPGGGGDPSIVSSPIDPVILGNCSASVHDTFVVIAEDGKKYRTWHPRRDPATGCIFAHEHGDDPFRSNIPNLPPIRFSYFDQGAEAHEGFKVAVINNGDRNNEGSEAFNSTRIVAHQGTGGAKRFTTKMHSLEIAFFGGPNGRNSGQSFFTGGMADTGQVASICGARQGRTVMQTDCNEMSDYEIWEFKLNGLSVSWSVFDPITERRPSDNAAIPLGSNKGCTHEVYAGPFNSAVGTYRPLFGQLPQGLGYLATYKNGNTNEPMSQFKITRPACEFYSSIGPKN